MKYIWLVHVGRSPIFEAIHKNHKNRKCAMINLYYLDTCCSPYTCLLAALSHSTLYWISCNKEMASNKMINERARPLKLYFITLSLINHIAFICALTFLSNMTRNASNVYFKLSIKHGDILSIKQQRHAPRLFVCPAVTAWFYTMKCSQAKHASQRPAKHNQPGILEKY